MQISNEHRLTEVEERSKSNQHRIEAVEKRQDDLENLTITVQGLVIKEENVEKTVNEIKDDVKTLTVKPAKKWDNMTEKITWLLVSAALGYILAQLGL